MEGKDNIKELFSQKLGNYEAKVNPELWAKISTQVAAATTTTVATGLSVLAKIAIGLGISAAAITTVVLLSTSSEEATSENPSVEIQTENSSTNSTKTENIAELKNSEPVLEKDVENEINAVTKEATVSPDPTERRVVGGLTISPMSTKQVGSVNSGSSEPQIVEGVRYNDMTNYGVTPVNTPEIAPEVIAPKPEAVKRYVNVFTPNGDGTNDYFELISEGLTNFSIVVFNPKGDIVFKSSDPGFRWDGRDIRSGEMVEAGTYMYMVSAYDSDGNPYPIYERLTITR